MDSNTVTESDLSVKSRSFLHRVNDWVRKMLDQSSKAAAQDSNKHSLIWWMFMTSTLEASIFMWKEYSEKLRSDEIYGANTINLEDLSWKQLSLVGNEEIISPSHAKVFLFSDSVSCFGKMHQNPQSNTVCEEKLTWFTSSPHYRTLDKILSHWISSGIFSQDSPYCSSAKQFKSSCQKWAINQKNLKDGSSSCRCSTTSHGDLKTMNRNANSFLGPGSETKWYSTYNERPQGEWDRVSELMMIKFGESGHPVFRATSPLSRGVLKSKGGGKLSQNFCADEGTIETVFRTIVSVNQRSIYGAVAEMCEEYESCHVRTGRLVLVGQSTPSTDDPAQEDLLQKYRERVERLSQ